MKKDKFKNLKYVFGVLAGIDVIVWFLILFPVEVKNLQLYFLDIGQGDSSLLILPHSAGSGQAGGVKMLIDGGPPNGALDKNLERIFPANDRYVDLVMISHPQLDHFGGFIELLKNYKVGAVLTSDKTSEQPAWQELEKVIKEKKIRRIILTAGDKIKYQDSEFNILSPRSSDFAKDINDFSLVTILNSAGVKAFFGGDISAEKEKQLADLYDVDVDILKVSHHGSRFSSNLEFLKEASPSFSGIEVGKNNYGHPTQEVLDRLKSFNSQVFRTDQSHTIRFVSDGANLYKK